MMERKERYKVRARANDRNGSLLMACWFEATMYCMFNSYWVVVCVCVRFRILLRNKLSLWTRVSSLILSSLLIGFRN